MDVLSQVELNVHNVLQASNPLLFLTRYGGPITFHLQVGEGEEKLISTVRKTVNGFGGRYFKRYHEMTPYTVLLVTDRGFRRETYNRPAICVTYVGDCVHSNFLRNINDYLHPWDDQERWKKIDLFEVIYSQNRMFQCSSRFALCKPYVPVSRKFKIEDAPKQTPSVQNHIGSSVILEVVSSDDDDLFMKADDEKQLATSEATTNVRSSPFVDVHSGLSSEIEGKTGDAPLTKQPEFAKDSLEETQQQTGACRENSQYDHRSTTGLSQQETLHPSKCINQKAILHRSQSTNEQEMLLPLRCCENTRRKDFYSQSKPTHKLGINFYENGSDKLREPGNHKNYCVTRRNPYVLLNRITKSAIQNETSPMSVVSGQENPKETTNVRSSPSADLQTGLSMETAETGFKRPTERLAITKESFERTHQERAARCEDQSLPGDHRSATIDGLNQQEMPLSTRSTNKRGIRRSSRSRKNAKCKEIDPQSKEPLTVKTRSNKNKECSDKLRETGTNKDCCATKKNPRVLLCTIPEGVQDQTSTLKVVPGQENPKERSGSLNMPTTSSNDNKNELASLEGITGDAIHDKTPLKPLRGHKLPKKGSGDLIPSTTLKKTDANVACESSVQCTPKIVSFHSLASSSTQGPSKKDSTNTIAAKPSGKKYVQLQITIKNSGKGRQKNSGKERKNQKNKQHERNSIRDEELVSDSVGSSILDVRSVPMEIPILDVGDESLSSHQNAPEEQTSQLQGTDMSTSSLGLVTPKQEIKEEPEKKRGRGFQDRYRRCEKVALLKWLVEHNKFRNLRGVLVWREMERKQVIPGRPYQSLKNQFLKNLVKKLDDYTFLTERQKRKFRGDSESSDEDEGFFYHGCSHNFRNQ